MGSDATSDSASAFYSAALADQPCWVSESPRARTMIWSSGPTPWFIAAIVLTLAGIILISLTGLHRKSEAVPTLPASSGPANRFPRVVPVSPIWKRG